MCNFEFVQNNNFTAVFVNEKEEVPKKIIPLGVYRMFQETPQELCIYTYMFEDAILYQILDWEVREPKDAGALSIIKNIIEQQKGLAHLLKSSVIVGVE